MSPLATSRLLEITIISAHNLPPVSKLLRTFAVAYIDPDEKLNTRIDHQGHTNPTWNHKVVFPVDDRFLKNASAAVTFEIYNLAWLRDLPVGIARLNVNSLSPPLHKNPGHRRVSIRLSRPSGHLRGTIHLGVQLVDKAIPSGDARPFPIKKKENEEREICDSYKKKGLEFPSQDINPGPRNIKSNTNICKCTITESRGENRANNWQPLAGEVRTRSRKGLLSNIEWNDYRASILESWLGSESMRTTWEESTGKGRPHQEKKKTGLLSCFGKGELSFLCG